MLEKIISKIFGRSSKKTGGSEFTQDHALCMVRMFIWLDYSSFARKPRNGNSQLLQVVHRSKGPKDENVIYTKQFSSDQLDLQVGESFDEIAQAGADTFPINDRSIVLSVLASLNSRYGNEGAKRFAELSYIAHIQANTQQPDPSLKACADFWADFRTFIDVERATQTGIAFDIEHFLGEIFATNDADGPRIRFLNGPSMEPSMLKQLARQQRSQF